MLRIQSCIACIVQLWRDPVWWFFRLWRNLSYNSYSQKEDNKYEGGWLLGVEGPRVKQQTATGRPEGFLGQWSKNQEWWVVQEDNGPFCAHQKRKVPALTENIIERNNPTNNGKAFPIHWRSLSLEVTGVLSSLLGKTLNPNLPPLVRQSWSSFIRMYCTITFMCMWLKQTFSQIETPMEAQSISLENWFSGAMTILNKSINEYFKQNGTTEQTKLT